jgi:RIO-like serine/threonine protein kinase
MHARGVAHNDLHKEQNVIVLPDGAPGLIDFQLASVHRLPSRLLERRAVDDLRHIAKHRRRYLRFARVVDAGVAPPAELLAAPPRAPQRRGIAKVWRATGKPLYNFVTRRVLGRRDGEERRALHDEWPVWTAATRPRR